MPNLRTTRRGPLGVVLPAPIILKLRSRIIEIGEVAVGHEIGIGYVGVLRAAAELPIRQGTYVAIATWAERPPPVDYLRHLQERRKEAEANAKLRLDVAKSQGKADIEKIDAEIAAALRSMSRERRAEP